MPQGELDIATLVRRLSETEAAIQDRLSGQVDAVVDVDGRPILLRSAQQQLLKSEAEQRLAAQSKAAILDALSAHIALLDSNGVILGVNQAWRKFASASGLPDADHGVGQNYLSICDRAAGLGSQSAEAAAQGLRRVLRMESNQFVLEYPCHSALEKHWFRMVVTPLQEGVPAGVVVSHSNITQQRLAAQTLRASEESFRAAFEQAAVGMVHIGPHGNLLRANDKFCEMLGYAAPELEKMRWHDLTEPKISHVDMWLTAAHGSANTLDATLRGKDGRIIVCRVVANPILMEDDAAKYLLTIVVDVTEQKAAEENLKRGQALLRMAGRVAKVGGWALELPHMVLNWSDEVRAIHECEPGYVPMLEEAIQYYAPEHRSMVSKAVNACIASGEAFDFEAEIVTAKHRRLWVRAIGEAERDHQGRITRVQGAFQDITDRKELERQFLRSQRMESLGTLAGGIAHDLNNLIAPIMLGLGLLKQMNPDREYREILEQMERNAQRGSSLVKRVLSFARGVDGMRVNVRLADVVREVQVIIENTFPKNVTCEVTFARELAAVIGDPTQLHQVLLNLCVNARDAMPNGGLLRVSVGDATVEEPIAAIHGQIPPGKYVSLEVTDSGVGIPANTVDRIFEPFFTTKAFGAGTGLGLSTVMAIVRSHGGFLNVSSVPEKGSCFKVYLPIAPEGAAPSIEEPNAIQLKCGNGELILLVDDEASVRVVAQQTLERNGYRVIAAQDGAEAVKLFAANANQVSAVITDMMMPVMDGNALIAALKAIDPSVKVVAMSGLQTGVPASAHYLAKPFDVAALLNALGTALTPS